MTPVARKWYLLLLVTNAVWLVLSIIQLLLIAGGQVSFAVRERFVELDRQDVINAAAADALHSRLAIAPGVLEYRVALPAYIAAPAIDAANSSALRGVLFPLGSIIILLLAHRSAPRIQTTPDRGSAS